MLVEQVTWYIHYCNVFVCFLVEQDGAMYENEEVKVDDGLMLVKLPDDSHFNVRKLIKPEARREF
jgi:hypothetical protein